MITDRVEVEIHVVDRVEEDQLQKLVDLGLGLAASDSIISDSVTFGTFGMKDAALHVVDLGTDMYYGMFLKGQVRDLFRRKL